MKRNLLSAAIALILVALYVLNSASPPSDAFGIDIKSDLSTNTETLTCEVTITNRTDFSALYYFNGSHFGKFPALLYAFKTNGVWQYKGEENGKSVISRMSEHASFKTEVQIPKDVTSAKVAMSATLLTWRGDVGWYLLGTKYTDILSPIIAVLMHSDRQNRFITVWSPEIELKRLSADLEVRKSSAPPKN